MLRIWLREKMTESEDTEKREFGNGGAWRVWEREEEKMTPPPDECWGAHKNGQHTRKSRSEEKIDLDFRQASGHMLLKWLAVNWKECLELKRKVATRNTDWRVIEGLEVYGYVKRGIISREDPRAAHGSLREVYSEWLWKRNPHLLAPRTFVHCCHTKTPILHFSAD